MGSTEPIALRALGVWPMHKGAFGLAPSPNLKILKIRLQGFFFDKNVLYCK